MELNKDVKNIVTQCMNLYEYERKQIISILIMSTLTNKSNDEAKEIYETVINKLNK
jgi:hypothetical protein